MKIEDFLKESVEGYLFQDLEHMAAITLAEGEDKGAAGYPMVMATLSGMELLGALLFQHPYSEKNADAHFSGYWRHFLSRTRSEYGVVKGLPELVRKLVRHCLAHSFVTGPGVLVYKGRRELHLGLDTVKGILVIDGLQFFDDFKHSYQSAVVPVTQGQPYTFGQHAITRDTMQKRLDEMVSALRREAKEGFSRLKPRQVSAVQLGSTTASANFPTPGTTITSIRISNISSKGF